VRLSRASASIECGNGDDTQIFRCAKTNALGETTYW
jgi:hypothetical protein